MPWSPERHPSGANVGSVSLGTGPQMRSMLKSSTALVATLGFLQPGFVTFGLRAVGHRAAKSESCRVGLLHRSGKRACHRQRAAYPVAAAAGEIRLRHLQREPFVRQRVRHVPGRQRPLLDGQNPRARRQHARLHADLHRRAPAIPSRCSRSCIGPQQNATFVDSVDHSHTGLATKIDVVNGVAQMDSSPRTNITTMPGPGSNGEPSAGHAVRPPRDVAHRLQHHPVLLAIRQPLHHLRQHLRHRGHALDAERDRDDRRPGRRNAVGRSIRAGLTDRRRRRRLRIPARSTARADQIGTGTSQRPPGRRRSSTTRSRGGARSSTRRSTNRQPTGAKENWGPTNTAVEPDLRHGAADADGRQHQAITQPGPQPGRRPGDIQTGHPLHPRRNGEPVAWRWYQNGYDTEPTDRRPTLIASTPAITRTTSATTTGRNISATSPTTRRSAATCSGENDFFTDIANNNLPPSGGVFYIRGGYYNINIRRRRRRSRTRTTPTTARPDRRRDSPRSTTTKSGDDDHPSYSDHQITEAMAARVINAIASNPDALEPKRDHHHLRRVRRLLRPRAAAHSVLRPGRPAAGARRPHPAAADLALARAARGVARRRRPQRGDRDDQRDLQPAAAVAACPTKRQALAAGNSPAFNQFGPAGFQQKYLGPRDTNSPITDSLLSGFEPKRLTAPRRRCRPRTR